MSEVNVKGVRRLGEPGLINLSGVIAMPQTVLEPHGNDIDINTRVGSRLGVGSLALALAACNTTTPADASPTKQPAKTETASISYTFQVDDYTDYYKTTTDSGTIDLMKLNEAKYGKFSSSWTLSAMDGGNPVDRVQFFDFQKAHAVGFWTQDSEGKPVMKDVQSVGGSRYVYDKTKGELSYELMVAGTSTTVSQTFLKMSVTSITPLDDLVTKANSGDADAKAKLTDMLGTSKGDFTITLTNLATNKSETGTMSSDKMTAVPPPTATPNAPKSQSMLARIMSLGVIEASAQELPLEQQPAAQAAASDLAPALTAAGMPVTAEGVLKQGFITEDITGTDGKKYQVAMTQDGLPLLVRLSGGEWTQFTVDKLVLFSSLQYTGIDLEGETANNAAVDTIVKKNFNTTTLEAFSWKYMEPTEGNIDPSYDSWRQNLIKKWEAAGKTLEGHALLWPEKNPDWLNSKSKVELEKILRAHIHDIVQKYPDISIWTVVNEPYLNAPQYNYIRPDIFHEKLGDQAYVIAFEEAYNANPNATLVLNDTLNHASTGKDSMTTARTRELLTLIKANLPKDAKIMVGAQFHLDAAHLPNEADVIKTLLSYQQDFGVSVGLTEIDVDMSGISGSESTRLAKLADIYEMIGRIAAKSGVIETNFWGVDGTNWLEIYQNKKNAEPTMFNKDLQKKLAYFAFVKGYMSALTASK